MDLPDSLFEDSERLQVLSSINILSRKHLDEAAEILDRAHGYFRRTLKEHQNEGSDPVLFHWIHANIFRWRMSRLFYPDRIEPLNTGSDLKLNGVFEVEPNTDLTPNLLAAARFLQSLVNDSCDEDLADRSENITKLRGFLWEQISALVPKK